MANGPSLPPWISRIDPVQPATGFLQGYQTGASTGASLRDAEQRAAQFELAQIAAAEARRIQEKKNELREAEFNAKLRLDTAAAQRETEKATREAQAAARQLSAQQRIQRGMASGQYQSWAEAYADNPAAVPGAIGPALTQIGRAQQASIPPTFVPAGGYAAPGDVPFSFQGDPSDLVGLEGAPAHWRTATGIRSVPVGTQPKEGELTEVETAKLRGLQQELNKVNTTLSDPIRSAIAENTKKGRVQELQKERTDIQAKIDAILNKDQPAAPPPKPTGKRYIWDESTRKVRLVE